MELYAFLLVALWLAGCGARSAQDTALVDADGDGWSLAEDCDDADAAVNPGADEVCAPAGAPVIDDDCDGHADDADPEGAVDAVDGYADDDGDGYGGDAWTACRAIAQGGDCDDQSAATWPGADEICDGADNDCDGIEDEGAVDAPDWHPDDDGDGYGDDAIDVAVCEGSSGYIATGGDCDDDDASIHPGAEDTPLDGIDSDCDGEDAPGVLGDLGIYLEGESPGDYAGWGVAGAGDVDGDGYDDVLVGAPHKNTALYAAGAIYLLRGPFPEGRSLSQADAKITGLREEEVLGHYIAGAGDVDADGLDDVLFEAKDTETGESVARLISGPVESLETAHASFTAGIFRGGPTFGVAGAGDLNGDGYDDLAMSHISASDGIVAWLVSGPAAGDMDLADADGVLLGDVGYGPTVASAGDVDGDGLDDVLIGDQEGVDSAGAVWLVLGPGAGRTELSDADGELRGSGHEQAGLSLDGAGDVNGDGYDDLLIGAPNAGDDLMFGGLNRGAAYLVLGPFAGERDLTSADAILQGEVDYERLGRSVAGLGDVDGDGYDDLLIGVGDDSEANHLVLGPVSGALPGRGAGLVGETGEGAGTKVAAAGDTDGDGRPELLIGAPGQVDNGNLARGGVYLIGGPALGL